MGSFKSHSLKKNILQVVAVVCMVFACREPGRLQNGPSDSLDVLWCSRGPWSSSSFFRHTSCFPEVLNLQQNGFSVRYSVSRGDLVASTERTLHHYNRVTVKSRFRRQMRAAHWTTPSLQLWSVVTGTSQIPAPFESNPTLHNALLKIGWVFCHILFNLMFYHRTCVLIRSGATVQRKPSIVVGTVWS